MFLFYITINTCKYSCIRNALWNVLNRFNEICGIWRGQQSSHSQNTINFHFYFQNFIEEESNLCWLKQNATNAVDRKTQKEILNPQTTIHHTQTHTNDRNKCKMQQQQNSPRSANKYKLADDSPFFWYIFFKLFASGILRWIYRLRLLSFLFLSFFVHSSKFFKCWGAEATIPNSIMLTNKGNNA